MRIPSKLKTKKDYMELLQAIVKPLKPHYSKANVHLGGSAACYGPDTAAMEAFLRPLWGLVPYWAGGGADFGFDEIYAHGLAEGTNPDSEEYWGGFWDGDQRFVEMGSIAFGLLLTPEKLWEPLELGQRCSLAKWLSSINNYRLPESNWIFFRILVNIALKKLGCSYDSEKLSSDLDMLEGFYLGNGWYQDGDSGQRDYYVSFALHYFSLLYLRFMEPEDPDRCGRYRERAIRFAQDFIYWFDIDGTALPYGRSMTYRFVQTAFFSACAFADVWPFSVGVIKGIISRNLRLWLEKPIFDRGGLLAIGYGYPNLCMAEIYNAPGSPYWGLKVFTILALPDNHPFWSVEEEPLPALESQKLLPQGRMLIRRYPGHTTAYVPGKYGSNDLGHFVEKYGKFAYDTKFGFSVSRSNYKLSQAAPDSMLAFVMDDYVYVRRSCDAYCVTDHEVQSVWRPYPGITVESRLIPTPEGHIREHVVQSEIQCRAYDCGFAVATDEPGAQYSEKGVAAMVQTAVSRCEVISRCGKGKAVVLGTDPNTNLLHGRTRIPSICYEVEIGTNVFRTEVLAYITQKEERKQL